MLRVFIGYDIRQPIAYQVLHHSIMTRASQPVAIIPLVLATLPVSRRGLTEFTYSRYLVPWLCDFEGQALFLDADMLCLGDIYELAALGQANLDAVSVVKNARRFEWPSMMFFHNSACRALKPSYVAERAPQTFDWTPTVGDLPAEWNHCVGYDLPRADAKLVHFTMGIPFFDETSHSEYADLWHTEARQSMTTVSWKELMGQSVHREKVLTHPPSSPNN